MASSAKHLQLLILAATAADAEAVLGVLKRAQLPVRGAFSQNPKSLIRASHSDLILALIGATPAAREIAAAYAEIEQRIPLLVISPPGDGDDDALLLLRAGAQGLLAPGDEGALVRAVRREWKTWALARQAETLHARLKRSERHLQALLKAGVAAQGEGRSGDPQRLDREAALRSLTGGIPAGEGAPHQGLADLLPADYREALGPLLGNRGAASGDQPPPIPDLTLKPSGGELSPAEPAPGALIELQPDSQPPQAGHGADLPPLTLATSEEPLPDLGEPQALSGQAPSDDELIEQIERALATDGFKLAYQPVVSLRGDSQERYSVLLRLLDDNRSFRAADDLLEPAARSGRLPDVDRWVIQHALRELSDRRQAGHRAHFLLSLSAALLQDEELLIWICDQLRQHSIRGSWVSFQIQEEDARALGDLTMGLGNGLRQVKSRLIVAGFGRGTDSELLLQEFPMDFVRLAPSLTQNLDADELKQGHVKHLLHSAQSRGIKTIAGCIEDERSLAAVWAAGADYVQGKVLGRPSSVFELND
jgi:EAL domain-containing protein (putative c-di-GMP-specific phosphodiesterase class I)